MLISGVVLRFSFSIMLFSRCLVCRFRCVLLVLCSEVINVFVGFVGMCVSSRLSSVCRFLC